jgi:hypothetical protein
MAKFTLNIETEDLVELHTLTSRLACVSPNSALAQNEQSYQADNAAREAMQEKRTRARKADAPATPAAVAEVAVAAPLAQTAPVLTAAPASIETPAPAPAPVAVLGNTSVGERVVSYEEVKAALSKLMEAKSAKIAQETLKRSVGFGSLSSTPAEKYWVALDAINAELAT